MNPAFKMKKTDTIKRNLLMKYYDTKKVLRQAFKSNCCGKLSFTTDLWTSQNNYAIMAVTATCLDQNFQMKEVILAFRELKGYHSGKTLLTTFSPFFKNLN